MSKENKVNPGQYTQAGRLTPDETAREMKKQRETASPRKTEGGQFGQKAKAHPSRVTKKDPPSPREAPAASADKQHQETREAKQSD